MVNHAYVSMQGHVDRNIHCYVLEFLCWFM